MPSWNTIQICIIINLFFLSNFSSFFSFLTFLSMYIYYIAYNLSIYKTGVARAVEGGWHQGGDEEGAGLSIHYEVSIHVLV
jgi:hypothetical protein